MNLLSNIEQLVNAAAHTIPHQESNAQFISSLKAEKESIIAAFQTKQLVTVGEFCKYTGLPEDEVKRFLIQ